MLIERSDIVRIVTHDGKFHSDEVFAVFIVCFICESLNVEFSIERTRDMGKINLEIDGVKTVRIDVGGAYDPQNGWFDHHQRSFNIVRNIGNKKSIPYASAGLIWKEFGYQFCFEYIKKIHNGNDKHWQTVLEEYAKHFEKFRHVIAARPIPNFIKTRNELSREITRGSRIAEEYLETYFEYVHEAVGFLRYIIERDIVAAIDCSDVRDTRVDSEISAFNIMKIINSHNIDWIGVSLSKDEYEDTQRSKFFEAISIISPLVLERYVIKTLVEESSANLLEHSTIMDFDDGYNVCVINSVNASRVNIGKIAKYLETQCQIVAIPSGSTTSANEDSPDPDGEIEGAWVAYAIRGNNRDASEPFLFPREWAGLSDSELERVSGIEGAKFCHTGRFIIAATSKEQLLKMCGKAFDIFHNSSVAVVEENKTTNISNKTTIDWSKFVVPSSFKEG